MNSAPRGQPGGHFTVLHPELSTNPTSTIHHALRLITMLWLGTLHSSSGFPNFWVILNGSEALTDLQHLSSPTHKPSQWPAPKGKQLSTILRVQCSTFIWISNEGLIEFICPQVRLIDCRSFLEYNDNHIVGAVNICCSKLIKRRLQQEKVINHSCLLRSCYTGYLRLGPRIRWNPLELSPTLYKAINDSSPMRRSPCAIIRCVGGNDLMRK